MIAKLITNRSNIAYLSNFTGSAGFMLLTDRTKYLFTDFRYIERAKNTLRPGIKIIDITKLWRNPDEIKKNWRSILSQHKVKKLGIEESNLTVSQFKKYKKLSPGIKFIDISNDIENLREIKTPAEIKLIQKSQNINEKTFLEIKKIIQEFSQQNKSITEKELAWKIKEVGHKFGAQDVSFEPIVGIGKNSSIVHHEPGNTKLKKGDMVLIDMGMKFNGYCSDMTRIIFTGPPTPKQKQIYDLVLKAQQNAIKHIKAGITGKKADSLSRKIIETAGYGEQYGHSGGHGIGLDIHETPSLSEKYTKKLRANSIITVEPGIYLEGEFGIRIEDMILLTKTGNKNLTTIKA